METPTNHPEVLLTEILSRLSMRCISRFKLVCKTWKTTIESIYFRRRFLSLHQNSSPSWSLILGKFMQEEVMGSYGCQTWNLPKSPVSYLPKPCSICRRNYLAYSCSSNGLVVLQRSDSVFFVGNPVLQKWVEIPEAPYESRMFGLVSRVDVDGVVLSFKIVELGTNGSSTCLHVHIYSSETGIWTSKQLHCHTAYLSESSPISLNGTLYLLSETMFERTEPGVLIAHDFYSESDQCQIIPLPNQYKNIKDEYFKGNLTTSGGFLMYMDTLAGILKIWKLTNDSAWQLLWEIIDLQFIRFDYYSPIAMHPFESDIVYLMKEGCVVSYNLGTQDYKVLRDVWNSDDDHQDCFMGDRMEYSRFPDWPLYYSEFFLFQLVLPRWMDSVPCPPQTEIIDTTSLFPLISSMDQRKSN